jgi:hypothetical protein
MFTSGVSAEFISKHQDDDRHDDLHELGEPQEAAGFTLPQLGCSASLDRHRPRRDPALD